MQKTIIYNPPIEEIDVIYSDNDLIIVNKPSGLLSVPGRGEDKQDCLITRVQKKYPEALIVHRLDMPTSGILVVARSATIHRQLSKLFQERQVAKQYVAIVEGKIKDAAGIIDLPLITDWPNRPKQKVDFESGKPSQTHYERVYYDSLADSSRLNLYPITGRSHQLRVHLLSIGHRIMGDSLYATGSENMSTPPRLLLHAYKISFIHPTTEQLIVIDCPCPF